MSIIKGALYIIATPIGNLADLSPRARMVLAKVDLIVAEDTRHSKPMLQHFGIATPIRAYHDHNERRQTPVLIQSLRKQKSIALISDAGTPLLCDPGYHLVSAAHAAKIQVVPIPGPSALISALSASGFSLTNFLFEGYLPTKKTARKERMTTLSNIEKTLAFYEAPHRILACLEDATICFGADRQAALVKEISKSHEYVRRGALKEILSWLRADKSHCKGEFVLVIQGVKQAQQDNTEIIRILKLLLPSHSIKEASGLTAEITRRKKNEIYKLAMALKDQI